MKHQTQIPSSPKCLPLNQLEVIVQQKRHHNQRMVFTNGCFDILHAGHVGYLEVARKLGDYLVVGVNSDASVRKLKGPSRPIHNQHSRARVLAGLAAVDYVVIFKSKRVSPLLHQLKPEIYVKGGDYTLQTLDPKEREAIQSYSGKIHILPLWKEYSTTRIIQKIKR